MSSRREARRRRRRLRNPLLVGAGLAVAALILWGLVALLGGTSTPKTAVDSTAYSKGDCFADFDAGANSSNKVDCTQPHSAQLVGVENGGDSEAYPGREALEQRSGQLCRDPSLALPQDTSKLKQRTAYPTQEGWKGGDRRMDCYIVSTEGNTITASFLP